jgi:hypothetical protein
MYGVAGEMRSIFVESDAFLYNLGFGIIFHPRWRLATISVTIFNVPSITIAEINHDVFV